MPLISLTLHLQFVRMNLLIKIFCLAAILNLSETFQIYADVEKYNVKWEIDGDLITFSIEAETTGFVGLGFSRGGGMSGADIVVGGVRNGVPYLEVGGIFEYLFNGMMYFYKFVVATLIF